MAVMAQKTDGDKKKKTKQVNLRLTEGVIDRLKGIGEPFGLEPPQVIRRAIEEYIQRHTPQSNSTPEGRKGR